ncbi:hypothetical protein D6D01_08949 [Aureobasidium pullulans]|uniref:Uncharacterized protein n=1 Tax=Aureobasidium pullulans TaxID=5580 RepID=A0A4S9K843_AURPU|nr:hypothetical protein D6D01_08949 [Aureobasidium pullulans]
MKSTVTSVGILLYLARASQALPSDNGTVTVTSFLPAITVSSCPPFGMAPSQVAPVSSSGMANTPVYTTVLTQPCPSGFIPVTYTVTGQPTNVPPGFTTGVAVVNSKTELVTYPTASASGYMQSGYISPLSTGAGGASGTSGSGATDVPASAVGGTAGPGSSQGGSLSAANGDSGPANSGGIAASNVGSPSAISSDGAVPSGVGGSGMGGSNAGGSPTTQSKGSSISTVPASTSSMAIYTGGASTDRIVDSNVGPMLAVLFAGAVLI